MANVLLDESMLYPRFLLFVTALFVAPCSNANCDEPDEWQALLDRRKFDWPSRNTWTINSRFLPSFPKDTTVSVHFDPQPLGTLEYEFFHQGKSILELKGHWETAFEVDKNTVFIAEYWPFSAGCVVTAYNLQTGKKIWSTRLSHNQPAGHSGYSNRVALQLSFTNQVPGAAAESALIITGNESFCDYQQVLDARTGKSLALRNFRTGWTRVISD